jgi:surface antigen
MTLVVLNCIAIATPTTGSSHSRLPLSFAHSHACMRPVVSRSAPALARALVRRRRSAACTRAAGRKGTELPGNAAPQQSQHLISTSRSLHTKPLEARHGRDLHSQDREKVGRRRVLQYKHRYRSVRWRWRYAPSHSYAITYHPHNNAHTLTESWSGWAAEGVDAGLYSKKVAEQSLEAIQSQRDDGRVCDTPTWFMS